MARVITPLSIVMGSFDENQASTQEVMMLSSIMDDDNFTAISLTKIKTNLDTYEDTTV